MKNLKKFCTILLFALINFSCAAKENQKSSLEKKKEALIKIHKKKRVL